MPLDFNYKAICDSANPAVFVSRSAPGHALSLHRDLLGLSIETTSFVDWAQGEDPSRESGNVFVREILQYLGDLTKKPVPIRIGGSSADLTTLTNDLGTSCIEIIYPPSTKLSPYPSATAVKVSPDFYALCTKFPARTPL